MEIKQKKSLSGSAKNNTFLFLFSNALEPRKDSNIPKMVYLPVCKILVNYAERSENFWILKTPLSKLVNWLLSNISGNDISFTLS